MSGGRTSGRLALAVLLAGIVYVPLEEFVLKWAPVGPTGYALLRAGFEGALLVALAAVIAARAARGLALRATAIDGALLAFVALASCSLVLSDGDALAGLLNLRVLLRHVVVFYLAVYLALSSSERRRALVLVLAAAVLQALVGLVQHVQGGASDFWLPREESLEVAGVTKEFAVLTGGVEQGAVLGTTDHPVALALFLLVGGTLAAAILLAGGAERLRGRAFLAALVVLAGAGILFSRSRASLFALALALGVLAWLERREPRVARGLRAAALLLPVVLAGLVVARGSGSGTGAAFAREKETRVSPLASIEAIFTPEYLQAAESSRLWVLRDVGGEIARSAGWLGMGPDVEHVRTQLLRSGGAALHRLIAYRAFEDVYWVALLAYYGFLGLLAFLVVLVKLVPAALRARAAAREPWERAAAHTVLALVVVVAPLSFLAPTFDFRTFSYSFWLLAGLVAGAVPAAAPARVSSGAGLAPAGSRA